MIFYKFERCLCIFPPIFRGFSQKCIIYQLIFFKVILCILINLFDWTWLLYELSIVLIYDWVLVLKFLYMHIFLPIKFNARFSIFSIFILSSENGKSHCEVHVNFEDIKHELQENILYCYLHYSILWNLH